jgi:5-methyltetrahydrofolate--homocysteine methyltransferase
VQTNGNDLIVYDPEKYAKDGSTGRDQPLPLPRQEGRERLCIADYFRATSSSDVDVVAFQS